MGAPGVPAHNRKHTDQDLARVKAMRAEGKSYRQISNATGIRYQTVARMVRGEWGVLAQARIVPCVGCQAPQVRKTKKDLPVRCKKCHNALRTARGKQGARYRAMRDLFGLRDHQIEAFMREVRRAKMRGDDIVIQVIVADLADPD